MAAELLGKQVNCSNCGNKVTIDQLSLGVERHEPPDQAYDHLLWLCPTPDCTLGVMILVDDLPSYIRAGCPVIYWPFAAYDVRLRVRNMLSCDPMVPLRPVTNADLVKFHSACQQLTGVDEFYYLATGQLLDSA